MAAFSNYLENELLDHVLINAAYTSPTTVYVALFTADSGQLEAGTLTNEVVAGGNTYARQPVTFSAAASGATANTGAVSFVDMPAVTVTHVAIMDALTVGNVLFHGALSASKTLNAGDTFTIATGDLDISLD